MSVSTLVFPSRAHFGRGGPWGPPTGPPPNHHHHRHDHGGGYVPPPGPPPSIPPRHTPGGYAPPPGPPPPGYGSTRQGGYAPPPGPPSGQYAPPPGPPPSQYGSPGPYSSRYAPPRTFSCPYPPNRKSNLQRMGVAGPPPRPPTTQQNYGPTMDSGQQHYQPHFQYSQCTGKKKALCVHPVFDAPSFVALTLLSLDWDQLYWECPGIEGVHQRC